MFRYANAEHVYHLYSDGPNSFSRYYLSLTPSRIYAGSPCTSLSGRCLITASLSVERSVECSAVVREPADCAPERSPHSQSGSSSANHTVL